jgi:uncharacterized protein YbcI
MESWDTQGRTSTGAQISNGAVQLVREYTGRGPTKARTTISTDLVTIILGDSLTKAEHRLVAEGDGDLVLNIRRRFQQAMREDFTALVEETTGRKVIAFMSDQHLDPDLAAETFVLQPEAVGAEGGG